MKSLLKRKKQDQKACGCGTIVVTDEEGGGNILAVRENSVHKDALVSNCAEKTGKHFHPKFCFTTR